MARGEIRKSIIIAALIVFSVAYVGLTFAAPPQPTAPGFELHEPWKSIVRITFILPILLSWAFGANAVVHLLKAAEDARDEKARRMFRLLGNGVLALIMGSWIPTLISQLRNNFFARDSYLEMASTVAQNYAYVLFPLLGFAYIYAASVSRAADDGRKKENWPAALLLIAILGALWVGIIFTNSSRQTTSLAYGRPTYYISDPLIALTLVTPTIAAWLLGMTGALNFSALESKGSPRNRKAYSRIIHGLLLAVFNSMILNGLLSAGSERLLAAGLGILLVIVYIFVFIAVFSYWLIYRGAKDIIDASYEHQE